MIKPCTFPVTSICMLHDGEKCLDEECYNWVSEELSKGSSFFIYLNNNPTSISSCCRVQNEITDNTFNSTTGLTGIMTGSANVITLNINRIVQEYCRKFNTKQLDDNFVKYFNDILDRVCKYQIAYKTMLYDLEEKGQYSCSNAGYIYMKKLYCTIGVIGYCEAAKYLGLSISKNYEYQEFLKFIFKCIQDSSKTHSIYDKHRPFIFNVEAIPGENLAVNLYNWDKEDGYEVPEDQNLYSCYFFDAWNENISVLDKLALHGSYISKLCGGGQACHLNLDSHLSQEQYKKLINVSIKEGCNYWGVNVPISECKDCGHVVNGPIKECPMCKSKNIDYWVRIIGYIRPISAFSNPRQLEASKRVYTKPEDVC